MVGWQAEAMMVIGDTQHHQTVEGIASFVVALQQRVLGCYQPDNLL